MLSSSTCLLTTGRQVQVERSDIPTVSVGVTLMLQSLYFGEGVFIYKPSTISSILTPSARLILYIVKIVGLVLPASNLDIVDFSKLHLLASSWADMFLRFLASLIFFPICTWSSFLFTCNIIWMLQFLFQEVNMVNIYGNFCIFA